MIKRSQKNKALEIAEMLEKQVSETGIEQARNEVEKELTDD